jgi:hypothetical protein
MKKIILFGLAALLALTVTESCKKKKDDNNNNLCGEQEVKVATIPASGTVEAPQPGTSFPLVVNISSVIPTAGATIVVNAKQEGGSTAFFTETRDVTTTSNSFNITNTPAKVTCIVDVTVTSKSCNTNQWKGSYRYSAK